MLAVRRSVTDGNGAPPAKDWSAENTAVSWSTIRSVPGCDGLPQPVGGFPWPSLNGGSACHHRPAIIIPFIPQWVYRSKSVAACSSIAGCVSTGVGDPSAAGAEPRVVDPSIAPPGMPHPARATTPSTPTRKIRISIQRYPTPAGSQFCATSADRGSSRPPFEREHDEWARPWAAVVPHSSHDVPNSAAVDGSVAATPGTDSLRNMTAVIQPAPHRPTWQAFSELIAVDS